MVDILTKRFAFFVAMLAMSVWVCVFTNANVLISQLSAQEVEQGGSGAGAAGDKAEAAEAYSLGILLEEGGDRAGAFEWFASAAERGHIDATYRQARAYAEGRGVTRNDNLAVSLFQKAVEARHAGAMDGLGMMYFSGRGGLKKSLSKAEGLFRNAVQLGHAKAMYNLGNLYVLGKKDTPTDLLMAYVLLDLAAKRGFENAQPLVLKIEAQLSVAQRSQIPEIRARWTNSIQANQ